MMHRGVSFYRAIRRLSVVLLFLLLVYGGRTEPKAAINMSKPTVVTGGKFQKKSDGYWYYKQSNGKYLKSVAATIDGKLYCFDSKCRRKFGMQTIGKDTWYFGTKAQGYVQKNVWYKKDSRSWYYFGSNGKMFKSKWFKSLGKRRRVNSEGRRAFGMQTIGGKRYFFGTAEQGYLFTNVYVKYKNKYYYCTETGELATGLVTLSNGVTAYFDETGAAISGKQVIDGENWYFSEKGELISRGLNLDLYSDCVLLINADGKVAMAKNSSVCHANASTTKVLTALLALENCKMTDWVKVSSKAAGQDPSKVYLKAGDHYRMQDLLYGLLLPSGNDAAVAIAEHIGGSTTKFAKMMNERAKELGCTNTHFVTANGLDAGYDHYTTAEDLAKIVIYTYTHFAKFRTIVGTKTKEIESKEGTGHYLATTNVLLAEGMKGVTGIKTGYTSKAGYCFVGAVTTKKGNTWFSIALGAPTSDARWEDASTLLDYAYRKL